MCRRNKLFIFLLCVFLVFTGFVYAYPGQEIVDPIATGTTWVFKGVYSVVKFVVVEVLRPVKALTQGLTGIIGVPTEE